jgi:hypothetical protein
MRNIERDLISFFEQVAQKNERHLKKLKQEKIFSIKNESWTFTLPNLYIFLQNQGGAFRNINYLQFRKLIFNSPINQVIKLYGAEITIGENKTKVDNSIYTLIWRGSS